MFVHFFQVAREEAERAMQDEDEDTHSNKDITQREAKRAKHNIVGVGKASGRSWKQPAQRAGTLRNPKLSTSWEKKMKQKAEEQAYKAAKREALEAKKEAARTERHRREEVKKRKEENRAKSAIVQKVSTSTAKKMAKNKKLKKKLVTVDDSSR